MESIRIGNDIELFWSIFNKSDLTAYNLEGRDLKVYLSSFCGKEEINDFTVSENVVNFHFRGRDQKTTGVYTVILVENQGDDGMKTVDHSKAFKLVARSCETGGSSCSNIEVITVRLDSTIQVGASSQTTDYNALENKPRINNIVLSGNKTLEDLNIQPKGDYVLRDELPEGGGNAEVDLSGYLKEEDVNILLQGYQLKEEGKGLSTNDFTDKLLERLNSLENYNDTSIIERLITLETWKAYLTGSSADDIINTFSEVESFLQGITGSESLAGMLNSMRNEILTTIENKKYLSFDDLDEELVDGSVKAAQTGAIKKYIDEALAKTSQQGEEITVNVTSSVGSYDPRIIGVKVNVSVDGNGSYASYEGIPVTFAAYNEAEYTVSGDDVEGYSTPEIQTFTAVNGESRVVNLHYSTEIVTISAVTSDGVETTDLSTQEITVSDNDGNILYQGEIGTGVEIYIPTGTVYTVSVTSAIGDYRQPSPKTFTAEDSSRSIVLTYEPIATSHLIFKRDYYLPENILIENPDTLNALLAKFRRCATKNTGEGVVTICHLNDEDSTLYEGGTTAVLDGTEGDSMVYMPEFWYRREDIDEYSFRYNITLDNAGSGWIHVPASLVGTYKGFVTDGKLYSRSGVTPTVNMSYDDFTASATARGTGYQLIDFQQHCIIAMMLYARYLTRNLQSVIGSGMALYNSNNTTGSSNADGIEDTVYASDYNYVNGLGIEGVLGCMYEYMSGLTLTDDIWTITDPDGSVRQVENKVGTGWIVNMALEDSEYFDMIPTGIGGSGATHYADLIEVTSAEIVTLVAARSCFSSDTYPDDGVGYINALNTSTIASEFYTTRLAFRGEIIEETDVEVFKALAII